MKRFTFYFSWTLYLLSLIAVFSAVDYFFHSLRLSWAVPEYYYSNKIIFGFLWSIPALIIAMRFSSVWLKSLIFSSIVSVALQARYYFEGYPISFVFTFLFIHLAILCLLAFIMFNIAAKVRYNN